jgi:hypothetical protein
VLAPVVLAGGVLLAAGPALPQAARWQADIQIRSVAVRAVTLAVDNVQLTATITVYNTNDDDARIATLQVLLPVGVRFLSSDSGCLAGAQSGSDGTHGLVICRLGDLGVGTTRTVHVTTTGASAASRTFGAFVFSNTPDPNPANNYGQGSAR